MRYWPVQDAKAHFSEMLETCLAEGPQIVSRRGKVEAVLVPHSEWEDMKQRAKPTLKELLLAPHPRFEPELPARGKLKRRPPVTFE